MSREPPAKASFHSSFCLGLLLIFCSLNLSSNAAEVPKEYQVKAVFLFRFAGFAEWPSDAFATPQSPITICVLGTNPFGNALEQAVAGETVNGRSFVVKNVLRAQDIDACQILFVGRSEASQWPAIAAALSGRSILTVSDNESFLTKGGMIQLMTVENHVRFKINREAAEAAKLKLSSKLLRLAE